MASLTEEIKEKWAKLKKMGTLRFEVTERCNLRCVHCYVGNRGQKKSFKHSSLSLEKYREVLRQAKEQGAYRVELTGGEPFIYPGLKELCQLSKDLNFMVAIYTNATLITEETAAWLEEVGVNLLIITNYGTEKSFYEKTTRVAGSRARFVEAIKILKKYDILFKQQFMLLTTNQKNRQDLFDVCKPRVGVRIMPETQSDNPVYYRASDQAIKDVFKLKYYYHLDKGDTVKIKQSRPLAEDPVCNMGRESLLIGVEGQVKYCTNSPVIGSVYQESLAEIWQGKNLEKARNKILWKYFEKCQNCHLSEYRYSLCPVLNYLETKQFNNPPEEQCRLCRLRYEALTEGRGEKIEDE